MPDLAVIMSVYQKDRLDYIKKSVQSILTQTYTDFDFFIGFDGPVLSGIEDYIFTINDDRIKLLRIEKNRGLAISLNNLLRIVLMNPEYKLIARMDADDISMPTRFEQQRNFFFANPEISCIGSWYQEINEEGIIISYQKLPVTHTEIKKFFLYRSPFAHPSVMFRKEMIDKAGFYPTDTIRLEDYIFWCNALKSGLFFANLSEYLLQFRRDKNFYKRRSGIRFGLNYITIRFRINKALKAPFYIYCYSLCVGIIRMMPSFIVKLIYHALRKSR